MSDDTRYPCCEHEMFFCYTGEDDHRHGLPCDIAGCPGSVPVGPTKEGKQ